MEVPPWYARTSVLSVKFATPGFLITKPLKRKTPFRFLISSCRRDIPNHLAYSQAYSVRDLHYQLAAFSFVHH